VGDSYSFAGWGTHMLAGALAGISEHTVIYPVDAIKVGYKRVSPTQNDQTS
jgi:solute carrier family 25 iron transporter 28/37